ncbi:acyltransferase family protein [candidate division KSB1 bacterium]
MTGNIQGTMKGNRIYFLDNLRTFMIFLVVVVHAGGVYESSGVWAFFWIVDDPSTNVLSDKLHLIIDIFVMSTIFLISGYFTPLSLKSKNGWVFLKTKFKRLIIPWIIAVLTLIPLYKIIFLYSRNIPQESWSTYFHWSNGIWNQNWLWFLPVLFLFDILYVLFAKLKIDVSGISLKSAVFAVFITGYLYSIVMDIFNKMGWTKTILIDLQNERLLIYFMMFLLGGLCYKLKIFDSKPKGKIFYFAVLCTVWIPVSLYRHFYIQSFVYPGVYVFSELLDTLLLWLNFHLSLLCLLYIMISTFRYFLDKQGKIGKELSNNSYNVYIIHTIVLGGIALTMLNTAIPSLLKYLILTVSTYVVSNLLISFYRKVIKPKMLFNRMEKIEMKTVTTAMLIVTLLAFTGCGKQENSETENRPPGVSLQIAAIQGNFDAIKQHINAGSDLNKKDEYGSTPLIIAVTFGKTAVAKALIEAGADMKITNNEGATPLHIAAFFCRTEIVKALLDKGADKNIRNNAGKTALETVAGPFNDVKVIYDSILNALKPMGFRLDYDLIKETRPRIAEMLR